MTGQGDLVVVCIKLVWNNRAIDVKTKAEIFLILYLVFAFASLTPSSQGQRQENPRLD